MLLPIPAAATVHGSGIDQDDRVLRWLLAAIERGYAPSPSCEMITHFH